MARERDDRGQRGRLRAQRDRDPAPRSRRARALRSLAGRRPCRRRAGRVGGLLCRRRGQGHPPAHLPLPARALLALARRRAQRSRLDRPAGDLPPLPGGRDRGPPRGRGSPSAVASPYKSTPGSPITPCWASVLLPGTALLELALAWPGTSAARGSASSPCSAPLVLPARGRLAIARLRLGPRRRGRAARYRSTPAPTPSRGSGAPTPRAS